MLDDGRQAFLSAVNVGQNFGDNTMTAGMKRAHHAIACGETVVDHFPPRAFEQLLERPGIVQALYRIAAYRLSIALEFLDAVRLLAPEIRLAKFLMAMREAAGGADQLDCLQEDLAGQLGVSTMTLAKALKAIGNRGFVKAGYRKLTITNAGEMEAWLAVKEGDSKMLR